MPSRREGSNVWCWSSISYTLGLTGTMKHHRCEPSALKLI